MNSRLRPKGLITLINRDSTTIYSAMFPGFISGEYRLEEIQIDLRTLADRAGVALVVAEINGLNPVDKTLSLKGRPSINFTRLSLDVGSETNLQKFQYPALQKDLVVPIKPFKRAIQWIESQDIQTDIDDSKPFSVIGSGLAGIEIAFALRKRWPERFLQLKILPGKINRKLRQSLMRNGIELITNENLITGPTLLCTGSATPQWFRESALLIEASGRVMTRTTFQVIGYDDIFAVGDCGVIEQHARPASGVWAVRAAKPLANNLERLVAGQKLVSWRPQRTALQLVGGPLNLGWAFWNGVMIGPYTWLWRLKKVIDGRFIQMFRHASSMQDVEKDLNENHLCRGCAAKLPSEPLKKALKKAGFSEIESQPEDASVVSSLPQGGSLIQSIDGFPALISDPWLNARMTTLHACSDIWATGGSVISAQPLITLPAVSEGLQMELLIQILGGIKSVLDLQGAHLIGGHTLESRNPPHRSISMAIDIGVCVNGLVVDANRRWIKNGLQLGDVLLLSRGLGSGILFSAAMKGDVNPRVLDLALNLMNKSQHVLLQDLFQMQKERVNQKIFHACTDITGFGLLGHLSEMLHSSNLLRTRNGLSPLKIQLEAEKIPSFEGVLDLIEVGYSSTLAPANRKFWKLFHTDNDSLARFEWASNDLTIGSKEYQKIMELIIDPQTCGPLALACSKIVGDELVERDSWVQIGSVEMI